jgi:hypothetical protein
MKTTLSIVLSVVLSAGVIAANQLGAQTTDRPDSGVGQNPDVTTPTPMTPTTRTTEPLPAPTPTNGTSASVPPGASIATVQNIVEITRLVPAGTTAVTAFTVPAGVVLVVTDLVVTNTGTAATCGGAVNRSGTATIAPTTPTTPSTPTTPTTPTTVTATTGGVVTTTVAGTVTQTDSTVTGPLCVPAQTTMTLPLTTGIEFAAGQSVQLLNASDPAASTGTTPGTLGFHLRGLLVSLI